MTGRVVPFGERALFVELADAFDVSALAIARAIADAWEAAGHGEAVPAYASVVLSFDPDTLALPDAERHAAELLRRPAAAPRAAGEARTVEVATRYDGPDLAEVAALSRVSVDELIALHSGRAYDVYFLGFLPGFAYCGRLDPRIVAPRLDRPRERVPRGAVAIADGQTGIYPFASPGGWRLIGSTDLAVFDPSHEPPALLRPGDRVRFAPR